MIVRPASLADLPALLLLARSAGAGLTTLPADAGRLGQRLEWAHRTFAGQAERADADYLFVLEDSQGQVVGICALAGAVGMREPWYNYRLGRNYSGRRLTSTSAAPMYSPTMAMPTRAMSMAPRIR